MLDLEAASVADLEVGKWEGAETTIAVEAECIFKTGASGVGGVAFIVGDGNFFPGFDGNGLRGWFRTLHRCSNYCEHLGDSCG